VGSYERGQASHPSCFQGNFDSSEKRLQEQLKGTGITPGITAVLHTFGEDLKFNVHFHCIVTSGGVTKRGDWIKLNFFFYEGLRKVWQYHALTP